MKKALFSLAAVVLLAGCASAHQCVQPDPNVPSYSNDSTMKNVKK
jgi:uncharacterized lipoprotein YajG